MHYPHKWVRGPTTGPSREGGGGASGENFQNAHFTRNRRNGTNLVTLAPISCDLLFASGGANEDAQTQDAVISKDGDPSPPDPPGLCSRAGCLCGACLQMPFGGWGGGPWGRIPKSPKCTFHQKQPIFLLGTPLAPALREGVPYDLGTN